MLKKKINQNPLISVIINCHNGDEYLDNCIKSVLNQTYKNWEIIFFDNNSSDKSSKKIKNFNDNRIKYFRSNKTYTLYKARNLAVSKSNAEFITFLDVDDWWIKTKLEEQINFFLSNPSLDIIYSNLYSFFQKNLSKKIFIKKIKNKNITQNLVNKFEMPILTSMIKKKFFKKVKFNNNFTIIGDLDFFIRASTIGRIKGMEKPLAYYRYHKNNLSKKKINLQIKELKLWVNKIENKKEFKGINFKNIFILINSLQIQKDIMQGRKIDALRKIFNTPFSFTKLKYLVLILYKILKIKMP